MSYSSRRNYRSTRSGYQSRYRSTRSNYRPRSNYKAMKSIARKETNKALNKDNPLQWTDVIFDGGNVNTTPTLNSFGQTIANYIVAQDLYLDWPARSVQGGASIKQANVKLSYVHYQLRFQQDVNNIESSNTFRTLMYSFIDTYAENPVAIMQGGDVDLPPATEKVQSMYMDRMRNLRPMSYDPSGSEDIDPTPGCAIIKGSKRCGKIFKMTFQGGSMGWEQGDVRWEAQSDTVGAGLQLYGFIRLYFRIFN